MANVIAAMTRLSGLMEARCCGTYVNGMLWSKPHTAPNWTRNSNAAAAFRNPAITGCGVNLINVPSLDEPEQRLQHTAQENNPECNREDERNAPRGDGRRMGMNEAVE